MTDADIGYHIDEQTQSEFWARNTVETSLEFYSYVLSRLDVVASRQEGQEEFLEFIASRPLRDAILFQIKHGGLVAFAPQVLLVAIRRILSEEVALRNSIRNQSEPNFDELVLALLGVARITDMDISENPEIREDKLAEQLQANLLFNHSTPFGLMLHNFKEDWPSDWYSLSSKADELTLPQSPRMLLEELTECGFEERIDLATLMIGFAMGRRTPLLTLEQDEIRRLGMTEGQLSVLYSLGHSFEEHQACIGQEEQSDWGFYWLRRFPLLKIAEHKFLILRLDWAVERIIGYTLQFETIEGVGNRFGNSAKQFLKSHFQIRFEASVGKILERIFRRHCQIYSEMAFYRWWEEQNKKSSRPPMCDFVVQVRGNWLMVDATSSRPAKSVVFGFGGQAGVKRELEKVLTGRKTKQLRSAIELIENYPSFFESQSCEEPKFLTLVVTPENGLGWSFISARVTGESYDSAEDTVAGKNNSPVLISRQELLYLERVSEGQGSRVFELLLEWRQGTYSEYSLDQFLNLNGIRLDLPKRIHREQKQLLRETMVRVRGRLKESELLQKQ